MWEKVNLDLSELGSLKAPYRGIEKLQARDLGSVGESLLQLERPCFIDEHNGRLSRKKRGSILE